MSKKFLCSRPAALAFGTLAILSACKPAQTPTAATESADEFVARLNREMADLAKELNAAGWVQATWVRCGAPATT